MLQTLEAEEVAWRLIPVLQTKWSNGQDHQLQTFVRTKTDDYGASDVSAGEAESGVVMVDLVAGDQRH